MYNIGIRFKRLDMQFIISLWFQNMAGIRVVFKAGCFPAVNMASVVGLCCRESM